MFQFLDQIGKEAGPQQAGVLGVEAENQLVEVAGQRLRLLVQFLHNDDDLIEQVGGFLGNLLDGVFRLQAVGVKENLAQFFQFRPDDQRQQGDFVDDPFLAAEVGADADSLKGGGEQQRRVFQFGGVADGLLHTLGEQVVAALEFPGEMPLFIDIGKAAGYRFLKGEQLRVAVVGGRGMPDQGAKVVKEGLGRLPFAKAGIAPLVDKLHGGQGGFLGLDLEGHCHLSRVSAPEFCRYGIRIGKRGRESQGWGRQGLRRFVGGQCFSARPSAGFRMSGKALPAPAREIRMGGKAPNPLQWGMVGENPQSTGHVIPPSPLLCPSERSRGI